MNDNRDYLNLFKKTLILEARAIELMETKVTDSQVKKLLDVFSKLKKNSGALYFCGVGKSGQIAIKLAATFSSLGLVSHYIHPTEALHGDLGRINKQDYIVFISKSGNTEEILQLIPFLPLPLSQTLGLIGAPKSELARKLGLSFDCSVEKEACINNQAPTTSSTAALAMGDAMAVVYEAYVGISREGFALNHPGGKLGKSLRLKVSDLMTSAKDCPVVSSQTSFKEILVMMTNKNLGACAVVDNGNFSGVIVEGDIRRTLMKDHELSCLAQDMMNSNPITIGLNKLAFEALELMEKGNRQISVLPVLEGQKFMGLIRLHDILKAGL